ncbi:MAG: hypothetical protein GY906_36940 [bacterium]|nr:hypothetical protein [bacterium]
MEALDLPGHYSGMWFDFDKESLCVRVSSESFDKEFEYFEGAHIRRVPWRKRHE